MFAESGCGRAVWKAVLTVFGNYVLTNTVSFEAAKRVFMAKRGFERG